jgi:hypothetical protein
MVSAGLDSTQCRAVGTKSSYGPQHNPVSAIICLRSALPSRLRVIYSSRFRVIGLHLRASAYLALLRRYLTPQRYVFCSGSSCTKTI